MDPLSVFAAVTGGMQLFFQAKDFFERRKRRKQEQKIQQHHNYHQHQYSTPITTHLQCLPSQTAAHMYHNHNLYAPVYAYNAPPSIIPYCYPPPPLQVPWRPPPYSYPPPPPYPDVKPHFHHYQSTSSSRSLGAAPTYMNRNCASSPYWDLGGYVAALAPAQIAPHTSDLKGRIGIRTGRDPNPRNSLSLARNHWSFFKQERLPSNLSPTIAVVHWDNGKVDMFVESQGVYYKNYQVSSCNVVAFASLYQDKEVFSGEILNEKLIRCNKEISFTEPLDFEFSTNSWVNVGLIDEKVSPTEYEENPLFVVIVGGAIFGLISSLYESPWDINVDMESKLYNSVEVVARINSHTSHLCRCSSSRFSVFAFNAAVWIKQNLFIG